MSYCSSESLRIVFVHISAEIHLMHFSILLKMNLFILASECMNFVISGQLTSCKFCGRFLMPPNGWMHAQPESKELLSLALKKLKPAMTKVCLVAQQCLICF